MDIFALYAKRYPLFRIVSIPILYPKAYFLMRAESLDLERKRRVTKERECERV